MEEKKIILSEEEREKKIIFLEYLKKEIESLEYQKNNYNKVNLEIKLLRAKKVFLHLIKILPIYVVTGTITYPLFSSSIVSKKDGNVVYNISYAIVWLLVAYVTGLISHGSINRRMDNMDYLFDYSSKIKEKYQLINLEELDKKIKIKRDNLERLTR